MRQVPQIFDRTLIRQRQRRALDQGLTDFLLDLVEQEVPDRLHPLCDQRVTSILVLGPHHLSLRQHLHQLYPDADLLSACSVTPQADVILDEETLPFAARSFDLVISLFGLQWLNDLPGALHQIQNCLKPAGCLLAVLAGGETLKELRTALMQAELELTGGVSPRLAPMLDVKQAGMLLQRCGLSQVVADSDRHHVTYADIFALMRDVRRMGATGPLHQRRRTPDRRSVFTLAQTLYAQQPSISDGTTHGRLKATFELIWMSGRR